MIAEYALPRKGFFNMDHDCLIYRKLKLIVILYSVFIFKKSVFPGSWD